MQQRYYANDRRDITTALAETLGFVDLKSIKRYRVNDLVVALPASFFIRQFNS